MARAGCVPRKCISSQSRVYARGFRTRQHANPLTLRFYERPGPLWETFESLDKALHLDVGCGEGTMLVNLARACPWRNFLGIDVRQGAVARALQQVASDPVVSHQKNCHFVVANLELSHHLWLPYPGAGVDVVTIFHPDPLPKLAQRAKRRLVSASFALALAAYTTPGRTRVHVQSDAHGIFEDITRTLADPQIARYFLRDVPDPVCGPFGPVRSMREERILARFLEASSVTAARSVTLDCHVELVPHPPRIWRASYTRTLLPAGSAPQPPLHPFARDVAVPTQE